MSEIKCILDNDMLIYPCPHCGLLCTTAIKELACHIFRHGYDVVRKSQIPPHASLLECDKFANTKGVFGCCRPYKIIKKNQYYYADVCDYI